jgi:type I restriction enzyme S subunit
MVPNGWEWTNLGKLASKVGSGVTPKGGSNSYKSSGIPLIRSQNVLWGTLDLTDVAFIDDSQHEKMKGSIVCKGDVLLNITGASIGRAAVSNLDEANVNQHVCIIRSDKLAPEFLRDFLLSFNGQKQIDQFQAGGNRQGLNFEQIKSFKLPFPPLPEQRKIATILGTWDKAISTTERLIDNSKQQKKALMQQLLTGKKRLLDDSGRPFEGEWEEVNLSSLALSGKSNFTDGDWIESPFISESGCRLIQTGNIGVGVFKGKSQKYISESSFHKLKCTEVNIGDLLICRLAEPAGRACVVPDLGEEKMLTSVDVTIMKVDINKSSAEFLSHYFSLEHTLYTVSTLCGGSTRSRVSRTNLGKMKVHLPEVNEQKKITSVLTNADKEIELLEQQLADLKQEKKALMQQLLTGKRRVKVDDEAVA